MGKTREFFKKIGDIKGTFHATMGTIKDRNSKDLRREEIKKRWQEYTEELYKKDLNDWDNHPPTLEPDILEYEVKWAFTTSFFTTLPQALLSPPADFPGFFLHCITMTLLCLSP